MTQQNWTLEEVMAHFFKSAEPEHVHMHMHRLMLDLAQANLAFLPRTELVRRVFESQNVGAAIARLYKVIIEEWGDDPSGWQFPENVQTALVDVLCMHYGALDQTEITPSVQPTHHPRHSRRKRS